MAANVTESSRSSIQRGEALKNEGNTLHQQGKFRAAYVKYSEAIKADPRNAVYYANRSASSLALKEFMEAATDAQKAVNLDPKYAKAWGRLGTATSAIGSWKPSIKAWNIALICLPAAEADCTEVEKRMKEQFLEGLRKAESGQKEAESPPMRIYRVEKKDAPWQRAAGLVEQYQSEGKFSSALVVFYAHKEFVEGVETMNLLKKEIRPDGQIAFGGKPCALIELSNGLLRDPRVFHLDRNDWSEKYNDQVIFEFNAHGGWSDVGAKGVKELAQKLLLREGWERTRPAVATTVRAWMMRGFSSTFLRENSAAVEFHSRVVDILDWGTRVWSNVPKEDRGVIFEKTFIRGVKRCLINAIHQALSSKEDCSFTRNQLAELCIDLVADVDAHPPSAADPVDISMYLSFWSYPKADALACLGWYHIRLGFEAGDAESASPEFNKAVKYYAEAGAILPEDEEMALVYLRAALEACWFNNFAPKAFMSLMHKIIRSRSKMLAIWEHSGMSERHALFAEVSYFALLLAEALEKGNHPKDTIFKPCYTKAFEKFPAVNVVYLCGCGDTCSVEGNPLPA